MSPKPGVDHVHPTCTICFTTSSILSRPLWCFALYSIFHVRSDPDASDNLIFIHSKAIQWFLSFYLITLILESSPYRILLENCLLFYDNSTICMYFRCIRQYSEARGCFLRMGSGTNNCNLTILLAFGRYSRYNPFSAWRVIYIHYWLYKMTSAAC